MRKSNLSLRLGLLIETLGITQKELSRMSDVSDSIISRVIKGQWSLSSKNIIKIVDATKISPSWLLGYGEDEDFEIMED